MPAQLMAVIQWTNSLSLNRRPKVLFELAGSPSNSGIGAGPFVSITGTTDSLTETREFLYRYTATFLPDRDASQLRLATLDAASSTAYQQLLRFPVETLPLPPTAMTDCHSRVGRRPIVVAFLGYQRPEKGFGMLPQLASSLLSRRFDIRMLIHNSAPKPVKPEQQSLRAIAASDSRLMLDETAVNPVRWRVLLDQSDLIVCPYDPVAFTARDSGIVAEALANGIPLVVPDRTSLSVLLRQFGSPGIAFEAYHVNSVFNATLKALEHFDQLAGKAQTACRQWEHTHGASRFVDAMLNSVQC
jgi:hypothetical protein